MIRAMELIILVSWNIYTSPNKNKNKYIEKKKTFLFILFPLYKICS